MRSAADPLANRLDRWVGLGLISEEQARAILAAEPEAGPPGEPGRHAEPRAISPVAEGLGYVGGVLVVVAVITIAGRYWPAIGVTGRIAIALGAAALLLAIGAAVPQVADAGRRLRAVSWTLSVVALGFGLGLLGSDGLGLRDEQASLLAAAGCAGYAAALWWRRPGVLLQAALLVALAVTAGSAAALLPAGDSEAVVGMAIWGVGVVWLLLGWGAIVGPWHAVDVCGGIAAVVGAQLTIVTTWGWVPALGTVVGLVTAGVLLRDIALTAMGAVATLLIVPVVSERYFPGTLGAPVALLVAGTLLVAGALYVARRGGRRAFGQRRTGTPRTAVGLAAAVTAAVTAVVLSLGVA